jgi:hypothetical protein
VIEDPAAEPSPPPKVPALPKGKRARTKKAVKKAAAKKPVQQKGRITLPQAIAEVLKSSGEAMKAVDIRNAIIKQKLLPKISKSFSGQVAMALSTRKEFKRVGRGTYKM